MMGKWGGGPDPSPLGLLGLHVADPADLAWCTGAAQGVGDPVLLLSACRSGVHRDGPLGGADTLVYNLGGHEDLLGGVKCHLVGTANENGNTK